MLHDNTEDTIIDEYLIAISDKMKEIMEENSDISKRLDAIDLKSTSGLSKMKSLDL